VEIANQKQYKKLAATTSYRHKVRDSTQVKEASSVTNFLRITGLCTGQIEASSSPSPGHTPGI